MESVRWEISGYLVVFRSDIALLCFFFYTSTHFQTSALNFCRITTEPHPEYSSRLRALYCIDARESGRVS